MPPPLGCRAHCFDVEMLLTREALLAVLLLLVASVAHAQPPNSGRPTAPEGGAEPAAFPPSAVTLQDKIDWLTLETDAATQAAEAEADKPLAQQSAALYRTMLERGTQLIRLINTLEGRFPRLEAHVNDMMSSAAAGLERIANGKLKIGMSADQVLGVRGEPAGISEAITSGGVRQQWRYGVTVLVFENGALIEIHQTLKGE